MPGRWLRVEFYLQGKQLRAHHAKQLVDEDWAGRHQGKYRLSGDQGDLAARLSQGFVGVSAVAEQVSDAECFTRGDPMEWLIATLCGMEPERRLPGYQKME